MTYHRCTLTATYYFITLKGIHYNIRYFNNYKNYIIYISYELVILVILYIEIIIISYLILYIYYIKHYIIKMWVIKIERRKITHHHFKTILRNNKHGRCTVISGFFVHTVLWFSKIQSDIRHNLTIKMQMCPFGNVTCYDYYSNQRIMNRNVTFFNI